jgi:transposase-like protein
MRDHRMGDTTEAGAAVTAPTYCPSCRSADVRTTSKVITAASYWRCEACGEVWNAGRRRDGGRGNDVRRWR